MQLERLVRSSDAVAATAARRAKRAELAACLRDAEADEIAIAVAFLSGSPRQTLGVAYAGLAKASAPAARAATLALHEVDATFEALANVKGTGANAARARTLGDLLARATTHEQSFMRRLLTSELRQGALEGVMLEAIAEAYGVEPRDLRRAVMVAGDLGAVAQAVCEHGTPALDAFRLQIFRPLQPMLAQPAVDIADALSKLASPILEWKIDGARVHVHRQGDRVQVYSRQRNDVTRAVPELVSAARSLPVQSCVLDGEAVALRADGQPHAFQTTMRRFGRRLDVEALRLELPLTAFFFDLLYLNGEDLIEQPAHERIRLLDEIVPSTMRVERTRTASAAEAEAFLQRALCVGHEGVMAKDPNAVYEAGRRGGAWLKIKRAHTLDLVVLAVEWGNGRRRGLLSNLHLGARDPSGSFVMLGKTFKGMTDAMLAWQTEKLLALERHRDARTVYVKPQLVVEVAFDGVQTSSQYPGGVALRFARVKAYREDKSAADADTIDTVRGLLGPGAARG